MKLGLLVGWGIVIYAVVFLVWSLLVIHGQVSGALPDVILVLSLVAVTSVATRSLHLYHWYDVLPYSLGWVVIAALLDLACAVPVSGLGIWADWHIWVGYALLALVPLAVPQKRGRITGRKRY